MESFSNNETVINARRRLQDLHQIAHTDSLTRIGNRQHIERRIRAAIVEFEDSQNRAGLLFMDIDHFKRINDTHGHDAGDLALRMVANTFRLALRATDTIGRWGGEEFVAILHDISSEDALLAAAEKVRSLIEASRLDFNGHSLTVTASIGATLLNSNDTPEFFGPPGGWPDVPKQTGRRQSSHGWVIRFQRIGVQPRTFLLSFIETCGVHPARFFFPF